jgi:Immunity protein 70
VGLYLAVFDGDDELEGVEVGSYADFGVFRDAVAEHLERGVVGSQFPTLMLHSDCDGSWSPQEAAHLQGELEQIADGFRALPPLELKSGSWQSDLAKTLGIIPSNLYESFFDVDGESLIERLLEVIQVSRARSKEILFQ